MRFVIIATVAATLALIGCGRKEQAVTPPDSGAATASTVTVTVAPPPPPTNAPGAPTAPSPPPIRISTPDYAPLFPGAVLKATSASTANGHRVGSVTYLTAATPQMVIDFYKPKVAAAGFTTSADANIGVGLMYAATDAANQRTMQVIATTEASGTAVVLSWTGPKP